MFRVIIPARYASSRLPGKPLSLIGNKFMIEWVYQRALDSGADSIVIATDDKRIEKVGKKLGAEVFISSYPHETGTERIAEVVKSLNYADEDIVINLQGDQPFLDGTLLKQVATCLENSSCPMSTLYASLSSHEEVFNPNTVKLILDKYSRAIYFSRAPIPWLRDEFLNLNNGSLDKLNFNLNLFHQHIGLYAYRAEFIKHYIDLAPSPLEQYESLEQLRVLFHGYSIITEKASCLPGQEINTQADLDKANNNLIGK